jgi:Xaa-Pro dipeptidase
MPRTRSLLPVLALLAAAALIADVRSAAAQVEAPVDPYEALPTPTDTPTVTIPPRLGISDLPAMQGLFAVQRLDGWLLQDRDGQNAVALQLVAPIYRPAGPWYYLLPASGEPVLICQAADAAAFEKLAGRKVLYQSDRELQQALRGALKGKKTLAMELALASNAPAAAAGAKAAKPARAAKARRPPKDLVRDTLRALKISVVSSDQLVQYTTAVWGQAGHTAHHVAVHHLIELRKEVLVFVARQLRAGAAVTEHDVQQRLQRGMAMRGVVGPAPRVAAGAHTAEPAYSPTQERSSAIREGDLISISLALRLDKPDGIFAAQTWVAYAGASAPERIVKLFDSVTLARDQAIALIAERYRKRRPLRGYEVDALVRATLTKAGLGPQLKQRTGHSIGTALEGTGANLDEHDVKDTRSLVAGTGVTVAPGVYFEGELGVRSEVTLFLSPAGPQITTPPQLEVEALLAP